MGTACQRETHLARHLLEDPSSLSVCVRPPRSLSLPVFLEQLLTQAEEILSSPGYHPLVLVSAARELTSVLNGINSQLRSHLTPDSSNVAGDKLEELLFLLPQCFKRFCQLLLRARLNQLTSLRPSELRDQQEVADALLCAGGANQGAFWPTDGV